MGQGVQPWRAVAAFALAAAFFCYGFVHRVAPSVMVAELMRDLGVGAAVLGNLAALYFWAYAGLQIPVGVLLDRLGPRRLISGALAIIGFGSVVFAYGGSLLGLSVGRLLIGVGAAFSWVGCLTVATQMFEPRRFPLLTGIAQTVGVAGAVLGQVPLALAIGAIGWQQTNTALGLVGLALAAGFWLLVRDRARPPEASHGLLAGLKLVARNPQTWTCALFSMSLTAPIQAFAGLWGVPYLQVAYGIDKAAASQVTTFMFYGWMGGAISVGFVINWIGRRRPVAATGSFFATATLAAVLFWPHQLPLGAVEALLALHGLSAGVMLTGFIVAREQNPASASGAAYGLVNTCVVGIGGVTQLAIGTLLDLRWQGTMSAGIRTYDTAAYLFAFTTLTILGVAGFLAATRLKEPRGA
jgi:predicted MFS family arabinose efflux permease